MTAFLQRLKVATQLEIPGPFYFLGKGTLLQPISEFIGVTLAESIAPDNIAPLFNIEQLLKAGIVERFKLSYVKNGRNYEGSILIAADKAPSAPTALFDKDYNGGVIKRAYRGRKAYFS